MAAIYEFFGYRAQDASATAKANTAQMYCPFIDATCTKTLSDGLIAGVCTLKQSTASPVICCPNRLYGDDYRILRDVSDRAFDVGLDLIDGMTAKSTAISDRKSVVAVFGKRWGKELRLPQRLGRGGYFVDWVLALLNPMGELVEFVAVEVQTIDTTGNYRSGRQQLLDGETGLFPNTAGLNWENVNKRILPQIIYKGQVLQRERLCRKGLFFVTPTSVKNRIVDRLGGPDKLIEYQLQPSSITFLSYDFGEECNGTPTPLVQSDAKSTTVYKVQEAFNNITLDDENVYETAIRAALGE